MRIPDKPHMWPHPKTYNTSRREGSKCARNVARHVKLCGQLMQEEWFVAIKIIYVESSP